MKFTLIVHDLEASESIGPRTISSYLTTHGFDTRLIFLTNKHMWCRYTNTLLNKLIELCRDSDLIGMSTTTHTVENAIQVTQYLKRKLNIPIIWGGVHATVMPEESLKYADMVCIGEGEEAVSELLNKMKNKEDFLETQNIWFKKANGIKKNKLRPLNDNLDRLPCQDHQNNVHYIKKGSSFVLLNETNLDKSLYRNSYAIMATRGCFFQCSYCIASKYADLYSNYGLRKYSPERIIDELKNAKKNNPCIKGVLFLDDNFFFYPEAELIEFFKIYKRQIGLPFRCYVSPHAVKKHLIGYAIESGLYAVGMGIQTGSKRILKLFNRPQSNSQVLKAANILNKFSSKLPVRYDIMLDVPEANKEDILDTLNLIMQIPLPFKLNLFSLTFYPGTGLFYREIEKPYVKKYVTNNYRKNNSIINISFSNLLFRILSTDFKYKKKIVNPFLRKNLIGSKFLDLLSVPIFLLFERKIFFLRIIYYIYANLRFSVLKNYGEFKK